MSPVSCWAALKTNSRYAFASRTVGAVVHGPPQVPSGKDARGGVDVRLGVVADAEAEQLHHLAAEVLLGPRLGVVLAVEPHQHRRIAGHLHQEVAEVAERVLAEQLELPLRPAQRARLVREHLGALHGARLGGQLAVGGGEVVVPEERHLLLQRTPRVHHAEHPALARVVDVDVGREQVACAHLRVVGPSDALVDVVGPPLVVDQVRHRRAERHVRGTSSTSSGLAPNPARRSRWSRSGPSCDMDQSAIVTTPLANEEEYCRRFALAGPFTTWPVRL